MRIQKPSTWKGFGVYVAILIASLIAVGAILDHVVLPMIVASTTTLEVPNVEGKDVGEATIILEGRGLEVMPPHEQYSSDVREGVVINQMPYGGATVKEGRRVYLTVSKGVETAIMPDLRGRTMREARLTMLRMGMQIGNVSYESNDSVMADNVIFQSIPPGSKITSDVTPSLVISQGPTAILVPSLVGLNVYDARTLLEQTSLMLTITRRQKSTTFNADVVLFQDPAADSLVQPGSVISIVVSE